MKTLLIPVDFSKYSEYALQVAAGIASKSDAELIILHVVEGPEVNSYSVDGEYIQEGVENDLYAPLLLKKKKQELRALAELEYLKNIKTKFELILGSPFHGISKIILEYKVDLVVMGANGHSKSFLGSITNKVVSHARCPVITLHNKPATRNYKNIVYSTRMFTDEEIFSRFVRTAQHLYDSVVHLVRINTPSNFLPDHEAKRLLKEFAKSHQFNHYTTNVFSDLSEEEGILHFSEMVDADLIAIATRGRSGLMHLLAGSISKEIVNRSNSPVMTFLVEQ